MKASDLFVKALEEEGVEYIFGIPGEENLDMLDSLRDSSIKLILTRHEQGAAFMAATYGRLTGKAGVCMATLGPGATNFVTCAAYAQLGGMPMIMITGQKPVKKSKQGLFQIVDIVNMMKPLTKYTRQVVNGARIPTVVREAFRIAEEEKPGAAHIELPEDVAAEEGLKEPVIPQFPVRRPIAEIKAVKAAAQMIQEAKLPILLIGAGANRKRTGKMLREFIDKTGIPFVTTQMGKGVVDERHGSFLGTTALSSGDYVHYALDKADLIINVGHDVVEKPPFFMEIGGTKVIHINFFSAEVDQVYFPQLEVVGDIANSIWQLTEHVGKVDKDLSYFERVKEAVDSHITERSDDDRFPVIPQRLVAAVRDAMPEDGIIALDNGMYKIWFARNYPAYQPNTVLLDNALATMGAGLPSAMAAKIVNPNQKVLAICGDGGFMMNSQEIETAVRLGLDLVVLILNDSAYGMIKWKQAGSGFDNFGLDFNNPDFVKYAESYGAHGHRAASIDDVDTLLQDCLNAKGVHIIDMPIDYSENERVLIEELKKKAAEI